MNENLSRRDFLKVTSLFLFSKTFPKFNVGKRLNFLNPSNRKNVLIIVFDALTANNISFLGYPRNTMTKLSHYIEKATVYHNNYSGGNFTTPGTGSLLTGTLPWTHRAFEKNDTVKYSLRKNNIFNIFGKENYYRFSYTHNPVAERLIMGFLNDIDDLIPRNQLFLNKDFVLEIFKNDYDIAALSRNQIVENPSQEIIKNSLFLPEIYNEIVLKSKGGENKKIIEKNLDQFPRGVPKLLESEYFLLEDGIDYLIENIGLFQEPFLGYFHFFPPHKPYSPRREFAYLFGNDEINIPEKPEHIFSRGFGEEETLSNRLFYDQYIAYVDAEFARLFKSLEENGLLDNTWLVFTSDHGEMFERGIVGHSTNSLFEPVIKVPLLIFEPGQKTRRDIYTPTSSIDILPTLLHMTGQTIPEWAEGRILPPFSPFPPENDESIFTVQARKNGSMNPLKIASIMMRKNRYKLHAYFGYKEVPKGEICYEFYDLENDPEELENLYDEKISIAQEMQNEMLKKIEEVNEPYL